MSGDIHSERVCKMISFEWMGPNSGLEDDRNVLLDDESLDKDMTELTWLVVM